MAIQQPEEGAFAITGGKLLFKDTFTDTNGVLLENHTPDYDLLGSGWIKQGYNGSTPPYSAGITIMSNMAMANGDTSQDASYIVELPEQWSTFTVDITPQGANGVFIRSKDLDLATFSYLNLRIRDAFNDIEFLQQINGGASVSGGSAPFFSTAGVSYSVTFEQRSDGKIYATATDDTATTYTINTQLLDTLDSELQFGLFPFGTRSWDNIEARS